MGITNNNAMGIIILKLKVILETINYAPNFITC